MANIIGEPIDEVIAQQINTRQKAHGSGTQGNPRSPEYHSYLNSKTAWVKLASAIEISEKRLKDEKLNTRLNEKGLAKYAVLFGGVSRLQDEKLRPRGSFNNVIDNKNNIWDSYDGTYNVNASSNGEVGEFGLVPMPGIESVDVQNLNRGSIKKATVKLKCYSPEQFKILDLLYLRIGYTMFLEWGWAPYLNNDGNLVKDYATLIERKDKGFFDKAYWKDQSYLGFLRSIEGYRKGKQGNYDGLLCKVTNFSWTFAQDGSYDIELSLISLGDVVESLKTNITPNYPTFKFIDEKYTQFNDSSQDDQETEDTPPSPVNNWISAYFFVNKLLLFQNRSDVDDPKKYWSRRDIYCEAEGSGLKIFGVFIDANNLEDKILSTEPQTESIPTPLIPAKKTELEEEGYKYLDPISFTSINTPGKYYTIVPELNSNLVFSNVSTKEVYDPTSLIEDQKPKDMAYLHWNSGESDEDLINDQGFYIRFGHLLDILNKFIIPRIDDNTKDKTPIIKIDSETSINKMYLFPYQVSLDPRVCIVNSDGEDVNTKKYYTTLKEWKNTKKGYARTMNIYVNCAKINEIISSNIDEENNLNLFSFLEAICTELNKALGGVNNLEPVVNEINNTLYIVDGSYTEPKKNSYELELYGYNSKNPAQPNITVSNFVRNFSIKTEITNDFATMATVGSTAGGYVKGTENTMFSKWNKGLVDTFKEKLIPADPKSRAEANTTPEPQETYVKEFWWKRYSAFGLTAPFDVEDDVWTSETPNISPEMCDKNIALVAEFYRYCQFKLQEEKEKYSSPTNGFIPISLSITLDGISGIKIYNALNVVTRFLPQNYPDSLKFIIKGVNHRINGNDWETTIETVVIANNEDENKTPAFPYKEIKSRVLKIISDAKVDPTATEGSTSGGSSSSNNAPGSSPGSSVYNCSGIPQSNGLTANERQELKNRNTNYLAYSGVQNTDESVIQFIRSENEGGYFHPIHAYNYIDKKGNIYDPPEFAGYPLGNGGETLWGEDRKAGGAINSELKIKFWSIVDKWSGFGKFYKDAYKEGKKSKVWQKSLKSKEGKDFNAAKDQGWSWHELKNPNKDPDWKTREKRIDKKAWKKDLEELQKLKIEIVTKSFYGMLDSNFANYPELKNLILSDVRTRYMWYRARYNGGGYFQNYAHNLKSAWNSGERNLDKLICIDLTYRYNYNKGQTYEPDILKTVDYVIPNR